MTTARTLIEDSLSDIGVAGEGQAVSAADAQLGLARLNDLIDAWAIEALYAFAVIEYTGTAGNPTSIGPAGNVVTPYIPPRIEGAFVRFGAVDYGIDLVSYQEYADIGFKSLTSPIPQVGYYDPQGALYLYPVASGAELHVSVLGRIDEFATLSTDYTFQPGVRRALRLSLNEELAHVYQIQLLPSAVTLARTARRALKRSNNSTPQLETYSRDISNTSIGFGGGGVTYSGVDGGTP